MSLYEEYFDGDWETLDRAEAVDRAYVLGVATTVDEGDEEEFRAITGAMDGAYDRNMVELAFEEGKNEGREAMRRTDADTEQEVWEALTDEFDGPTVTNDLDGEEFTGEDRPTPDRSVATAGDRPTDPPVTLDISEVLDGVETDSGRPGYPDFLE